MSPGSRVIIDTDPGVDDVLAMLLAFSALPADMEVLLLSLTFGNVEVKNCLRNVVSMFHVIEKELRWRNERGRSQGFESLRKVKPLVAVGAETPLADQMVMADYFHGLDGLGGIHTTVRLPSLLNAALPDTGAKHPEHTSPEHTWKTLLERPPADTLLTSSAAKVSDVSATSEPSLYKPSTRPSHLEIIRILQDNPIDTIDIIAIGPLTNLALAASESPQLFLRAKSVLVMGGAIAEPGNITPVGEFNTLADPTAAARVFALTSPDPATTMPLTPPSPESTQSDRHFLPPYPSKDQLGDRRLNVVLFPLDITNRHTLRRDEFEHKTAKLAMDGSPLADWARGFLGSTFRKMETLHHGLEDGDASLSLHDPLCVWYALTRETQAASWQLEKAEDIRIETAGQWTRGMCVTDKRNRKKFDGDGEGGGVPGDNGGWLSRSKGNRVNRCVETPGDRSLAPFLLDAIFGR